MNLVELDQYRPRRRKLADERMAYTHKFSIAGHEGYLTTGLYDDGQPGEIFLKMAKEGSTVSGLMDTIATMTSIALQYGGMVNVAGWPFLFTATITMTTGTMFLMWLGEQVTERGIGNGISMLILAGIISGLPAAVGGTLEQVGFFNPVARGKDKKLELNLTRIAHWTGKGATMSDRVRTLVSSARKQAAA